jgi:anhydro-N-acetylmuramic acid kinase
MPHVPDVELHIPWTTRRSTGELSAPRCFVGVHLDHFARVLRAALVRIWGSGLAVQSDVLASSTIRSLPETLLSILNEETPSRAGHASATPTASHRAGEFAELAARAVNPLLTRLHHDPTCLRAIGLYDFGQWQCNSPTERAYQPWCDAARLAQLTGLTVIDAFPNRDLAHGGRGGPFDAVGAWLMLADRGLVPGKRIRALLDLDGCARLSLLPPRQAIQLPAHLLAYDLAPAAEWLEQIHRDLTSEPADSDHQGHLAVQGHHIVGLKSSWRSCLPNQAENWDPRGLSTQPLTSTLSQWIGQHSIRLADVLCTATQLIAERITQAIRNDLPRAYPIGQIILSGALRHHALLFTCLQQQLPEIQFTPLDELPVPVEHWRAASAALLAALHVDQIPANSPSLTGADAPRILGCLTPGAPGNWHRVMADMARTLPDKMPLRNAI